jgi:FixJ family two-component response regulator
LPIIFITAHADIPCRPGREGGAIEFLAKPFRNRICSMPSEAGLARDRARRENDETLEVLKERFSTLSSREREIMIHVSPQQADCRRHWDH